MRAARNCRGSSLALPARPCSSAAQSPAAPHVVRAPSSGAQAQNPAAIANHLGMLARMRLSLLVVVVVVSVSWGASCAPPEEPTGDDGARYLGFEAGTTHTFQVDASTETHEHKKSSVASSDGVAVDLLAKDGGGFVVQARSFTLEVTGTTSFVRRLNDCINPCGEPNEPIAFLDWPIDPGAQHETTVTVQKSENGTPTETEEQTHTILVGDETSVTVPAGEFDAFLVSWTVQIGEESTTDTLTFAPDEGVVKWQTSDGKTLERQ
jgi:hypothetical protein